MVRLEDHGGRDERRVSIWVLGRFFVVLAVGEIALIVVSIVVDDGAEDSASTIIRCSGSRVLVNFRLYLGGFDTKHPGLDTGQTRFSLLDLVDSESFTFGIRGPGRYARDNGTVLVQLWAFVWRDGSAGRIGIGAGW